LQSLRGMVFRAKPQGTAKDHGRPASRERLARIRNTSRPLRLGESN
jgi:hypothetical protein